MKNETLQQAEAAVAAVDQKLEELDQLTANAKEIADSIETAKQVESEILASDQPESKKVNALIKARTELEVKSASLKKLQAETGATQDEAIAAGIAASNFINAIEDGLKAARTNRVTEQLSALFEKNALKAMQPWIHYSKPLRDLDRPRFCFIQSQPGASITNCRAMRAVLDKLVALVNAEEPELEVIVTSEAWRQPVAAPAVSAPADRNALGSLL